MACTDMTVLFCTILLFYVNIPRPFQYIVLCSFRPYSVESDRKIPKSHMTNSVSGSSRPPQKINFRQGSRHEHYYHDHCCSSHGLALHGDICTILQQTELPASTFSYIRSQHLSFSRLVEVARNRHRTESSKAHSHIHHELSRDDSAHGRLGRRCREYAGHE